MDKLTDRQKADAEFMLDTRRWQNFLLPLRRRTPGGGWPQIGYKISGDCVVYVGNMYTPQVSDQKLEYSSIEDVVLDGWEVD